MSDRAEQMTDAVQHLAPAARPASPVPPVPAQGRVALIVTSPRVAAGLLSWPAWQRLQVADQVLCADPGPDVLAVLEEAGVAVQDLA